MTNLDTFIASQSQFNTALTLPAISGAQLYRWGASRETIPMYIRSAEFNCGMPSARKFFEKLDFHGDGTCQVRIYVDGAFWAQATLIDQEAWDIPRRINLPAGTRGYGISFEMVGAYNLRGVEIGFSPLPGVSDS